MCLGLLRVTPQAESITFSVKNVGEEEAAEEESCQHERPEHARQDADDFRCARVVNCIKKIG